MSQIMATSAAPKVRLVSYTRHLLRAQQLNWQLATQAAARRTERAPLSARRHRCAQLVARAAAAGGQGGDDELADIIDSEELEELGGEEEEEEEEEAAGQGEELAPKDHEQQAQQEAREDRVTTLVQRYLSNIQGTLAGEEEAAAAAAAQRRGEEGASRREAAAALLSGLPGIRPEGPRARDRGVEGIWPEVMEESRRIVVDSPPLHSGQIPLDEWELRAIMEKRRRREEQHQDWMRRRSEIGMYPTLAADWRSDIRIRDTGDPTAPTYREWTHQEIWDLITLGGKAADPRDVPLKVLDPEAPADPVAEGAKYVPETEDWLADMGMLIDPEDEQLISDRQSEEAMLASEFSDFDEEYLATGYSEPTASFDESNTGDDF